MPEREGLMIQERSGDSSFFDWFEIEAGLVSQNGVKHLVNEDRYLWLAPGNRYAEQERAGYLFGVFDGCGGTGQGHVAAQMSADIFRPILKNAYALSRKERLALLEQSAIRANNAVFHAQTEKEEQENMASAATVLWIWEEGKKEATELRAAFVHIGDSAAFLYREGRIEKLTKDFKSGHLLTSVLGMKAKEFRYQSDLFKLEEEDILLIASDGLWKPHAINLTPLIEANLERPLQIAKSWLVTTRRNGSEDDQTAIAIKVS